MENVRIRRVDATAQGATILSLLEPFAHFKETCRDACADFSALIEVVQVRRSPSVRAGTLPLQSSPDWIASVHKRLNGLQGDLTVTSPLSSRKAPH